MDFGVLAAAAIGAAIIILTPGPGVLALLAIGAAQGRRAGAEFVFGHLVGDLMWGILALVALVGAHVLAPGLFRVLSVACGAYLVWLGWRAIRTRPGEAGSRGAVPQPLKSGVFFGLTNPKSYPLALSIFAAALAGDVASITPATAPQLLVALVTGYALADVVLIWIVGLSPLRRLYARRELAILRATGTLFIFFGATTFAQAWTG